jgi:hypothetical protein
MTDCSVLRKVNVPKPQPIESLCFPSVARLRLVQHETSFRDQRVLLRNL